MTLCHDLLRLSLSSGDLFFNSSPSFPLKRGRGGIQHDGRWAMGDGDGDGDVCVSLCVAVFHCVSLCVAVCHCVSLCVSACVRASVSV